MHGVALFKAHVAHTFRSGVFFAALFRKDCLVSAAPDIAADHFCLGISFRGCNGQRAAAAAHVQARAAVGKRHKVRRPVDDRFGKLTISVIIESPVQGAHPDREEQQRRRSGPKSHGAELPRRSLEDLVICAEERKQRSGCGCPGRETDHHALGHPVFIIRFFHFASPFCSYHLTQRKQPMPSTLVTFTALYSPESR